MALLARRTGASPASLPSSTPSASSPAAPPNVLAAPVVTGAPLAAAAASTNDEPTPFRIAQLESDAIEVVHAKVGKRSCLQTLTALSVSSTDAARVATAIASVRKLDGCNPSDRVFVALNKSDHHLRALELETTPGAIVRVWERDLPVPGQTPASAGNDGLAVEQVTLPVTHKRIATGFVIASDLSAAVVAAGLDPTLLEILDEAIGSRTDVPPPARGSTFRVIADATYVGGRFDRYDEVVALEYQARPDLAPLRLYHGKDPAPGKDAKDGKGWFDAKGHQPLRAKWRMPLAFPRVTSRFNLRRKHPVLKVVMPHNGCDFAAPPGTPVYAIGPGIVSFRGEAGPSGNLVTVHHEGGIESGYAHLSRFAPGVVPGTHVEARTLIGYSGSTGRSTGPHLHLSVKRNGVFVDPLSLKMDAFRVVPPKERSGFAARKLEADAALDHVPLPKLEGAPPPAAPAASPEAMGDEPFDH